MKKISSRLLVVISFLLLFTPMYADEVRQCIKLSEGWTLKPITATPKKAELTKVTIPHTWNANYLKGTTTYNRETMVYYRDIEIAPEMSGKRIFLYFEGVNSVADVFINKHTAGSHKGGYTAFCLEITDMVHTGKNALEVWVSNAYRTDVLPISGDFNIYGGIHRPCYLIITDKNCISPLVYASPGVLIHQDNISNDKAELTVETLLSLKSDKGNLHLSTTISDAKGNKVSSGNINVTAEDMKQPFTIQKPNLWNGKINPYLYKVTVELYEGDKLIDAVSQQTGFRYISADADNGFFLNGKSYDVHGFCRHEDVEGKGSALLPEDYSRDMDIILESGATGMRLAHYPHGKPMYELSDEKGIILMTEIPLCGPGGYDFTGYLHSVDDNARQTAHELVYQNYNHPSICFWGIFNEILKNDNKRFVEYDDPIPLIKEINKIYKTLDPSRLTTFATCVDQTNYLGCSDLIAWNKYFGWYEGVTDKVGEFFDDVKMHSGNQPVGVSEYGAGASIHQHRMPGEITTDAASHEHPEEMQAACHEGNWEAFSKRKYLWGKFIWCFSDFQSSIRREGDRDGINDKGLVTYDRSTKKDAFFFYKSNWNPEPMMYITSRRYTERTKDTTDVKIYSNLNSVALYVNGKKLGNIKPDDIHRAIWKNIKLIKGENIIKAEGKYKNRYITDTCVWNVH
jgi:beta-galactosidase